MTESNEKPQSLWNSSQINDILKVLGIISLGQKNYGKDVNVKDLFNYFRLKLDGRFTAESVIGAIEKYTDRHNDIPAPSDVINILCPEQPKISYAEYKLAIEQWKANGYKSNCHYKQTMNEYEKQGQEDREEFKDHSGTMQSIGIDTKKLLKRF